MNPKTPVSCRIGSRDSHKTIDLLRSPTMETIFNLSEETNSTATQPTLDPALLAQLKSGANWFYWIAGLSVVNSLIFAFGGHTSFIAGLGLTQLIDGIFDAVIAGFHVFALIYIVRGFIACRAVSQFNAQNAVGAFGPAL